MAEISEHLWCSDRMLVHSQRTIVDNERVYRIRDNVAGWD